MNSLAATICTHEPCTSTTCRLTCALEVIDELLQAQGTVRGEEVDALLDLRSLLRHRENAEAALALFCQLRRTMEERHYLAFYRLRRWLENQIEATVRIVRGAPERTAALRLDWYCLEPVRFHCLQSVRQLGEPVLAPRVRFTFRANTHQVEDGRQALVALASDVIPT